MSSVALGAGSAAVGAALDVQPAPRGVRPSSFSLKPYDVVVVGGGPAGVCAALAAARGGARTLVVDEGNCLGGMATKGLVGPFMTCYDKDGEKQIIKGLFEEIVGRLVKIGGAIHPSKCRGGTAFAGWHTAAHHHVTPFEPEKLKVVLDELCAEAGVEVLFHAMFVSPLMEGSSVRGVELATKAGLTRVGAKVVIDATGDGDVAYRAGVPCELGDPKRGGRMQPVSTFFRVAGLREADLVADLAAHGHKEGTKNRNFSWYVDAAVKAGEWDVPRPHVNMYRQVREDEWFLNISRINDVDATDPAALSRAEALGRRQVGTVMNLLRKYFPGGENVRLLSTGSTLGIRESRHIRGDYWMDENHILDGRVPADTIACCAYAIDLHGGNGQKTTLFLTVRNGEYYGIPYRSLLPQKVENLLVAGRCISGSSAAAASFRVMPPAMATGEAAGAAAALAVKKAVTPRLIDAAELRAVLKGNGVFLG